MNCVFKARLSSIDSLYLLIIKKLYNTDLTKWVQSVQTTFWEEMSSTKAAVKWNDVADTQQHNSFRVYWYVVTASSLTVLLLLLSLSRCFPSQCEVQEKQLAN